MKKVLTTVCLMVFCVMCVIGFSDVKQPVKKSSRALEGTGRKFMAAGSEV